MKLTFKRLFLILVVLVSLGVLSWLLSRFIGEKKLELISPNGQEVWQANQTYQITWKSRKIGSVGIFLAKGIDLKERKWIAKDIPAKLGKYDWQIFVWELPSDSYKIGIIEYPWREGNKIDYSDDFFTILGPKFASCDQLSIEKGWPYIPSDFPDLRRVFITKGIFTGNLGGLEGADQKCQREAEEQGLQGNWKAFLGDDETSAIERLNLGGIFVEALPAGTLPEGKTCLRFLARNFDDFFKKFSNPLWLNEIKFEKSFLENLSQLWLGRIKKENRKECTTILGANPPFHYSFTTTCHNWKNGEGKVVGYPPEPGQEIEFPKCYTPEGSKVDAVGVAGLSSGLIKEIQEFSFDLGKSCNIFQKLLCIEQ